MGYSLVGADFVDDESGSSSESEADDNDVTAADGSKPVKKKTHTYKLEKCKDKTYVHCTLTVRWIRSLHLALTTKNQNNSCIGIQNTISFKLCLSFRLAACCVRVVDEDSCAFVTELLTSVRICGSIMTTSVTCTSCRIRCYSAASGSRCSRHRSANTTSKSKTV